MKMVVNDDSCMGNDGDGASGLLVSGKFEDIRL